eukprot:3694628-Rhodomonas_salina.1
MRRHDLKREEADVGLRARAQVFRASGQYNILPAHVRSPRLPWASPHFVLPQTHATHRPEDAPHDAHTAVSVLPSRIAAPEPNDSHALPSQTQPAQTHSPSSLLAVSHSKPARLARTAGTDGGCARVGCGRAAAACGSARPSA